MRLPLLHGYTACMPAPQAILQTLQRSKFRSRFTLKLAEQQYLREHSLEQLTHHAERFIRERLAPAVPVNDGRQTPMRGHPVFVAQHATACCCRGCLAKWHGIAKGHPLTEAEIAGVVAVICLWLQRQAETLQIDFAVQEAPLFETLD